MSSTIFVSLHQKSKIGSTKVDIQQKTLDDYFMTDAISRSSPTMAKCIAAVRKTAAATAAAVSQ